MSGGIGPTRIVAAMVALLVTAGLAFASRLPVTAHASSDAMLRLAWTARPERIEQCRTVGDEELAALPAHMRQPVVCEGVTARYQVIVLRDGQVIASDELRGGGLRNDRQLYHHREIRVPSGSSTLEVRVTRTHPPLDALHAPTSPTHDTGAPGMRGELAARGEQERSRRRADEIPPSLILRETVALAPREVMLVVYDRTARRLRAVRQDSR